MKNAGSTVQIDIDALRVGMFIHLDLGWMSHPFPLSSFRIASAEQIGVIRSLGLKKLRWSPEQSALAEAELHAARNASSVAGASRAPVGAVMSPAVPAPAAEQNEPATTDTADAGEQRRRRRLHAAQRAALAVCERQFSEAAHECRQLTDLVADQPQAARHKVQALSRALVDKMLGEEQLCIRLLTEAAGDKASAHAINVTLLSLLMGRSLGLSEAELLDLGVGALLHDMGKLDLPPRVRHREDHFSPEELEHYEQHVAHGVARARTMGLSAGATLVIAQHHEHADGSGFPLRAGSERITPASTILALVDRYDNLCNPPLPARALTPHEALSLLFSHGHNRFDTALLGAFIKMMGVYPPGSVVQLTDDRFAVVVGVNASRPLKPRVQVIDAQVPADEAVALDLERVPKLGIRRSLRAAALPVELQHVLSPRPRVVCFFEPVHEGMN